MHFNPADWTALIVAVTGLVAAVGGIIAVFRHTKYHPTAAGTKPGSKSG